MYGLPLPNNDAWYEPPEQIEMDQEKFEDHMSELVNDFNSVHDAIYDVFDEELFKLFHMEHSGSFHALLQDRVLQNLKQIVLEVDERGQSNV